MNSRTLGLDKALSENNVEALIAPTWTWLYSFAAVAGYPSISVPPGYMPYEVVGAPWDPSAVLAREGSPVGFCFVGGAWQESKLLRYAYDLEQELDARQQPQYLRKVPARVDAEYCSGKPQMHGGTGNIDWRAKGKRLVL